MVASQGQVIKGLELEDTNSQLSFFLARGPTSLVARTLLGAPGLTTRSKDATMEQRASLL